MERGRASKGNPEADASGFATRATPIDHPYLCYPSRGEDVAMTRPASSSISPPMGYRNSKISGSVSVYGSSNLPRVWSLLLRYALRFSPPELRGAKHMILIALKTIPTYTRTSCAR